MNFWWVLIKKLKKEGIYNQVINDPSLYASTATYIAQIKPIISIIELTYIVKQAIIIAIMNKMIPFLVSP